MTASTPKILGVIAALALSCDADGGKGLAIGEPCTDHAACESNRCPLDVCVDPDGDEDGDGVPNGFEHSIGSNVYDPDSDGDEILDGDELSVDGRAVDSDNDGKPDILESIHLDQDRDCITNQYDAHDTVPQSDLSPMRPAVCRMVGICDVQRGSLRVICNRDGRAECRYDQINGYHDPEINCDKLDENCDGSIDEGLAPGCVDIDWDDDGVFDDVDVCPEVADRAQGDHDEDGIGDSCLGGYTLEFVEPLPPGRVEAGETFDVHARLVRRGPVTQDTPPRPPSFHGLVTLRSLPDRTVLGEVEALDGAVTFEQVALELAGVRRLELKTAFTTVEGDPIEVLAGEMAELVVDAPHSVRAGVPFSVVATAYDALGNVTDYSGPAEVGASEPDAELPTGVFFSRGELSVAGIVLHRRVRTAVFISIPQTELSGSAEVLVQPGPVASIVLTLPADVQAGVAAPLEIALYDGDGAPASDFDGAVNLAVDDADAEIPRSVDFEHSDGGRKRITVVFTDVGTRTVFATLAALNANASTRVHPGRPFAFLIAGPSSVRVGLTSTITVAAVDRYGHPLDDPQDPYVGTIGLTAVSSADSTLPEMPEELTFTAADQAVIDFEVLWLGSGSWTLRAIGSPLFPGELQVLVYGSPDAIVVSLPSLATKGSEVTLVVSVVDPLGTPVPTFAGEVALSCDDPQAQLPATLSFTSADRGRRSVPVVFNTLGTIGVQASALGLVGTDEVQVVPAQR
jgi:hypothetical protein